MRIASATAITLVVAAGYSVAVYYAQLDKFWDWLNTLVGSGVSFFLALLAGIYLFGLQNRSTERTTRTALRSLLAAEMSDLLGVLGDRSRMSISLPSGATHSVLVAFVQPLAIEKAALSGLFSKVESENLLHLARKLRMLNFKSHYLMGLVQSRSDEQTLVHALENVEQTRIASIEGIRHVGVQLGLPMNESY